MKIFFTLLYHKRAANYKTSIISATQKEANLAGQPSENLEPKEGGFLFLTFIFFHFLKVYFF